MSTNSYRYDWRYLYKIKHTYMFKYLYLYMIKRGGTIMVPQPSPNCQAATLAESTRKKCIMYILTIVIQHTFVSLQSFLKI